MTRGIRVAVEPRYVAEESQPEKGKYFFAYRVEITNTGPDRVQLKSRHWLIFDGHGQSQEVKGAGVVGQQPVLDPGESFTYTSGCPLTTPGGTMQGAYVMTLDSGENFRAEIPAFSLDAPFGTRIVH